MPRGGVGEAIVDGIAEGVKQGIDGVGIGGQVVTTISTGVKSGNLGGTIRDAVIPAVKGIGEEIRSSASAWAGDIGNALRSGDIQGATDQIGNTVRNTTDLIATIGSTFGLQTDGIREFGNNAATTLSQVGTDIQGVVTKASDIYETLNTVGTVLDTALPRKAATGTAAMKSSWLELIPVIGQVIAAWELGKVNPALNPTRSPDGTRTMNDGSGYVIGPDGTLQLFDKNGVPLGGGFTGTANNPTLGGLPNSSRERRGYDVGGYTGSMPVDKIAGIVHGGEYVIKASSTAGIQNAYPGLLDYLNNKGALPGFKGGGSVSPGVVISSAEQTSMWDAVRGKFPSAVLGSGTRTVMTEGHPDYHNAGRAIDISGPGMGAIASWIASNYPESLELIHSPFGNNILNGKNVGDGMKTYGADLMAKHRNHIHWALGKTAKARTPSPEAESASGDTSATLGPAISGPSATPELNANTAPAASQSTSMSVPGSLSGLSSLGLSSLGDGVGETKSGSDLGLFGDAAGAAVSGQVSSALGVFGVNDTPGWLAGLSKLASGISISEKGGGDGASSPVSPLSAASSVIPQATSAINGVVHGGQAGQAPGPQVVYNIRTATVEDAALVMQRREKERAAANLARF